MKNNEVRAVLWDMDGVVADTARQHFESWQYAFERQKVTFPEEEFKSVFGQRNDIIIRKIMGTGVSPAMIEKLARDKEEFFRAAVKKNLKLFPGVLKLLRTIKENGIGAAIGSSAPLENIRAVLSGLGIETYFQALVYGLEVQEGKPSPQVFQLAAGKLGARPENCIVIEDAIAGVKAAKSGGMHCIAVTNTHPVLSLAAADLVVDSLELIGLNELNLLFNRKLK